MSGLTVYESIRFNKLSVRAADERVKVASAAQERQRAEGCFDTDLSPWTAVATPCAWCSHEGVSGRYLGEAGPGSILPVNSVTTQNWPSKCAMGLWTAIHFRPAYA